LIIQPILDLASICALKGIKEAILSPGSRCAPLSLAFIRHPDIHCRTISDERSAAFVAMGMAQQIEHPVVLVCTSGSAALNYFPAIAEAFFQQIPLLILTADRPAEWIDQWDGQTIRQKDVYGTHVKNSYSYPDSFEHPDKRWHAHRIVNEAINESLAYPKGPVHINIPLREPFYPIGNEEFEYSLSVSVTEITRATLTLSSEHKIKLKTHLAEYKKIAIIPGQQKPNAEVRNLLADLATKGKAVVIADLISNMQIDKSINHPDFILQSIRDMEILVPDLVISFGKSILSKPLKQFIRSSSAAHWHLQGSGYTPDMFQSLSKVIQCEVSSFLSFLSENADSNTAFVSSWTESESAIRTSLPSILQEVDFGEFQALAACIGKVPPYSKLHLSNSMPIRYASLVGGLPESVEIIANRGTSGIDGSSSTAVGCTFTTKEAVTLVTGDMAFFYDRNAFWHKYNLPNLRIIVLNNHAGGIFRLIEGPARLPELEEFFETEQKLSAKNLAMEFGFNYTGVHTLEKLEENLGQFYQKSICPKILEVFSESKQNAEILKTVKAKLKEQMI
jgi:2-succinyl-5-enolpyruvyl-6-hydroxy-3-cyclohexene-1-carboxylate synthase